MSISGTEMALGLTLKMLACHADFCGRAVEAEELADLPLLHAAQSTKQFDAFSKCHEDDLLAK